MLLDENKKPFGKKLQIVGAIAFIISIEAINFYLLRNNMFRTWFQIIIPVLEQMVIGLMAGFYGPIVGFIIGIMGKFLGVFMSNFSVYAFVILVMAFYEFFGYSLYGLCIGIFWKKYNFSADVILIKNILFFCFIQIMANLIFLDIINLMINNVFFFSHIPILIINKIVYTLPFIIFLLIYRKIKNGVRPNVV